MRLSFSRFGSILLLLSTLTALAMHQENRHHGEESAKTQKVNIVAERFNFTPSQVNVREGTLLEIELSSDDTFHGFRMPSANIDVMIPARGRGSIRVFFDAKKKGRYPFECSRPCGAGHTMMRGVIIVK